MIPEDLQDAMFMKMQEGESVRIVHTETMQGQECSSGKNAALVVTRTNKGLKYYCHRCKTSGTIYMKNLSPERVLELTKRIKDAPTAEYKEVDVLELPRDAMPVLNEDHKWDEGLPNMAVMWLVKNRIDTDDLIGHPIYWSPSQLRILFAIYDKAKELIGYVGRTVVEDYKQQHIPKYITRKRKGDDQRVFYTCGGTNIHFCPVVFVEDILSAIKVHNATDYAAVALLNASVNYDVAKRFKSSRMFIWLDENMQVPSLKACANLSSKGFNIRSIRTTQDPKLYDKKEIKEYVKNAYSN